MQSKFRLLSVLALVTFMVVAGCLMATPKANAQPPSAFVQFASHQDNFATNSLGQVTVGPPFNFGNGQTFPIPVGIGPLSGSYPISYTPAAGYAFVKWEILGGDVTIADVNSQSTTMTIVGTNAATISITYKSQPQQERPRPAVGGVVVPTNTLAVLAPYLAVIGLVATAAVAVKKRRNWKTPFSFGSEFFYWYNAVIVLVWSLC